MNIKIGSFPNGDRISHKNGFCVPCTEGGITFGHNRNPQIQWDSFPESTKSFALICVDKDVPASGELVNVEGKTISVDFPRCDFYHWVLADIPVSITEIPDGADSSGVTERGKGVGKTEYGTRGINDYTNWFANDDNMKGYYGGYDGPCPPCNDERIHHYYFTVYALDIDTVNLTGNFTGADLLSAIQGHILDSAEYVGTYTLNVDLLKK